MAKLSMRQAAEAIGVSKTTMSRHVESGKVSHEKNPNGNGYLIDESELARAFPDEWKAVQDRRSGIVPETPDRDTMEPHGTAHGTGNETNLLRAELKLVREILERSDADHDQRMRDAVETIADLRSRLDRSDEERRALNIQLLSYNKQPEASPPSSSPSAPRRGFLGLFKRAG